MISIDAIMTRNVITVREQTPIYEAMHLLQKHRISGLPVVDDEMKLIGILTEKDVLQILLNKHVAVKDTVAEYMTKKVISFSPKDNILSVCEFLIKNPFRRVPIVEDGKLVGIVSRRDIICQILDVNSKVSSYRFS